MFDEMTSWKPYSALMPPFHFLKVMMKFVCQELLEVKKLLGIHLKTSFLYKFVGGKHNMIRLAQLPR
jgi:hypothetical protein